MTGRVGGGLALLAGAACLAASVAVRVVLAEPAAWTAALAGGGALLCAAGACALRRDLGAALRGHRGEVSLYTAGLAGVLIALAHLSARYPMRFDLTASGRFSLSESTVAVLERLERPVHVVFFHDPMMRETVELWELIARRTPRVTVEFHDPVVNPAAARRYGVHFAGTAVLESEGRRLVVNGGSEVDIANGLLRVSRAATQRLCFLDGHNEPDPFSLESHDHLEGAAGHSHGLGARYVLHERHGMAKARHALEAMAYAVEKVSLLRGAADPLAGCAVLVVAGPKTALLPPEVGAIRAYLDGGGNALFMLDPFVQTGLEPLLREYGIVANDDIVIDPASHFWADVSSPAVSEYNRHQITRDLPLTFFPGARSLSPTPQRIAGTSVVPLVNASTRSFSQRDRERVERPPAGAVGPRTIMAVALRRPVAPDGAETLRLGPEGRPFAVPSRGPARPSRVVVVGDSDFATNSFFHIMGNGALLVNAINYLAAQESLIGIRPRTHDLPRVHLTNRQMALTFLVSVVLVPAVLALVGTAVWWTRR